MGSGKRWAKLADELQAEREHPERVEAPAVPKASKAPSRKTAPPLEVAAAEPAGESSPQQ